MEYLKRTEIISIGFMMFSIYFGAGNLIFPPAVGQAAGTNLLPAIAGFLLTGVGLPFLGIVAIAFQGGHYTEFISKHVHPKFAFILLGLLYLTIGPLFAIPRTAAVAFEIGVRPFISIHSMVWSQLLYTAAFFIATYLLALNPHKIIDRIGKILTPILLFFLIVLFARSYISPLGAVSAAVGTYITAPFAQGFQNGYLTMDLLASLAVGAIVVNTVRMRGVKEKRRIGRVCIAGGLISIILMSGVYISLAYIGATSAGSFGPFNNGAVLLANAASVFFGPLGNILLAVIMTIACLTTSCGIASACAWYFNKASQNRVSYQRILLYCILFSFVAANIGLTKLIQISVPFLTAMYPVVIVLVILSLFSRVWKERSSVYRWSLGFTLFFSIFDGINAAGIQITGINFLFNKYIPFYPVHLGWVIPALLGIIIGYGISCFEKGTESLTYTADDK
ncbi:branched-chain amino acid transport system II carrier protein [Pectinatus sottacetonis]|uniref:branched-chain amino acid transport system II carrier protein n=1 Tax=Pectinatus sottacetonis TaxID=1002795 RepID=UPI002EDAF1BC